MFKLQTSMTWQIACSCCIPWEEIKKYITARVRTRPADYFVSDDSEYRREAIRLSFQKGIRFEDRRRVVPLAV